MSGGGAAWSEYNSTGGGAAPVGAGLRGVEFSMEEVGPGKMEREKKEKKALQHQHSLIHVILHDSRRVKLKYTEGKN